MEANPEHLDVALQHGYAWISGGELSHADHVLADGIQEGRYDQNPSIEGLGLNDRGDVLEKR